MMKSRLITFCAALTFVSSAVYGASLRKRVGPPQPTVPAEILPDGKRSYYVPYVLDASGTRVRVPVMQIPGSVMVVPRQVMDDQQDIGHKHLRRT
jgi:hypothetical protein